MPIITRDNRKQQEDKEKREHKRWIINIVVATGIGIFGLILAFLQVTNQ